MQLKNAPRIEDQFRLWSLEEVLRFYAEGFLQVCNHMESIRQFLNVAELTGKSLDTSLSPPPQADFEWLCNTLEGLDLSMSAISARRMLETVKDKEQVHLRTLKNLCDEVLGRLHDELRTRFIFMVPSDKEPFFDSYSQAPLSKSDIIIKFPDMIEDLSEAGNCFALERYTASIFHLMRVMEKALQKIGNDVGIATVDEKVWQVIVDGIRKAIKNKYPSERSSERIKYEGILGHLETVKIAWRSPTMHPKTTYTEQEATSIFGAVQIFIKDLADIV